MHLLILIAFSLFQFCWADQNESLYTKPSIDPESKEVFGIPCSNKELGALIRQQKPVVPSRIYHYGPPKAMNENIQARTVPEKAWEKFIMGSKTKYSLDPIRRGLYGTAGIETNIFGSQLSKLIVIEIKPECRTPDKIFSFASYWEDPRFISWFKQNESIFSPDVQDCIIKKPAGFDSWSCSNLLSSFIEDMDIKIIHDNHYEAQKSFYIRDRACISNIYGNPEDMLIMMASQTQFWKKSCLPEEKGLLKEYNKFVSTFGSTEVSCDTNYVDLINKDTKQSIVRLSKLKHEDAIFALSFSEEFERMISLGLIKTCQSHASTDLNFLKSDIYQQILSKELHEGNFLSKIYFEESKWIFEQYLEQSKGHLNNGKRAELEQKLKKTLQPQYADELILKLNSQ